MQRNIIGTDEDLLLVKVSEIVTRLHAHDSWLNFDRTRCDIKMAYKHTEYAAIESALNNRRMRIKIASIAICRQSVDKWQSKTLFLMNFDLRSSIVLTFSIAAYPV